MTSVCVNPSKYKSEYGARVCRESRVVVVNNSNSYVGQVTVGRFETFPWDREGLRGRGSWVLLE